MDLPIGLHECPQVAADSPKQVSERKSKVELAASLILTLEVMLSSQQYPVWCGRELHKGVNWWCCQEGCLELGYQNNQGRKYGHGQVYEIWYFSN